MANENMTMDEAIDKAVDMVTAKGTGEPIDTDEAPAETQEVSAEATAKEAEVKTTTTVAEAEVEPDSNALASQLADLTHDDVVHTKAGKGLVAELQREREKRRAAEAEIESLKAGKPKAEEVEDEPEPEEDAGEIDDEADVFTAKDVKKIVAREISRQVKPLADRVWKKARIERQQIMATGLSALAAEQKTGSIPAGVNTSKIVNDSVTELGKSRPALLQELLSEPDPVRAVWEYATARMPEAKQALAQAVKAKASVTAERLAKGRSPDTGDEPKNISNLVADLNAS